MDPAVISEGLKRAWQRGAFSGAIGKNRKYKVCPTCKNKFYGGKTYCSLACLENSETSKKISVTRKELFKLGKLKVSGGTTKWITYKNIRVQGSYEYRTCVILDAWLATKKISKWEYTNDRVEYVGLDGNTHSYLLDFKVWNPDNTFYYLEVKGYQRPVDELKWNAVKKAGLSLVVWFNEDITIEESRVRAFNQAVTII